MILKDGFCDDDVAKVLNGASWFVTMIQRQRWQSNNHKGDDTMIQWYNGQGVQLHMQPRQRKDDTDIDDYDENNDE